jgi:hypothetical protein
MYAKDILSPRLLFRPESDQTFQEKWEATECGCKSVLYSAASGRSRNLGKVFGDGWG